MPASQADVQEIQRKIAPLLGRKAWGASLGVGSFVTLEFGEPRPAGGGRERPHGEWHLWVYCSAWRLERGEEVLAGSEDPRPLLEEMVKHLNGLTLEAVEVRSPSLEAVFAFEDGVLLHVFPIFSQDFEHWMLFTPDANVLTAGPGTAWSFESAANAPV